MKKQVKQNGIVFLLLLLVSGTALQAQSIFSFKGRGHHGSANYTHPEGISYAETELVDGSYLGSATGFQPDLTVEVTVAEGRLKSVEVVDHNEIGPQYYSQPIRLLPDLIVKNQSTNVDSVSGATATSSAIKAAVEDALSDSLE